MRTFLNLFGRSPFTPLQTHMVHVANCIHLLPPLFEAVRLGDSKKVEEIAASISESDHQADVTKYNIRDNLPKSLFMPIDRGQLLEILSLQDHIAHCADKIGNAVTLKQIAMPTSFHQDFTLFLFKNIECFEGAYKIIRELHELLESSFGGIEAEKVKSMVDVVSFHEHEASVVQRRLFKSLFNAEDQMNFATFILWQRIFEAISSISDLSDKLAHRVRLTLELK